jgi:hypothetical protein
VSAYFLGNEGVSDAIFVPESSNKKL